ncbi:DUF7674 family protein [Nocardioides taihuensis]|uniref:DUF7674 domain-containing protein n=1 Tax=Nocardioides taihuensis TaxID=1835606 RepID=A0ABW0BKB4_9ACTN
MPMTATYFLDALARDVPECQAVVVEHLEDNDGLLLHLLTAHLRRFAIQSFETGQRDILERLLELVDVVLRDVTDDVQNAMAVSFVEDTGWWDPATEPFIEAWPAGLRAEVDRQRRQRQ